MQRRAGEAELAIAGERAAESTNCSGLAFPPETSRPEFLTETAEQAPPAPEPGTWDGPTEPPLGAEPEGSPQSRRRLGRVAVFRRETARPATPPAAEVAEPAPGVDVCRITVRRRLTTARFRAVSGAGGETIAESQRFRARLATIDVTPAAVAAHHALVATLLSQGWKPSGSGNAWYSQRFVREASVPDQPG